MLALRLLSIFGFLVTGCQTIDPTQAPQRAHPALFFSNTPALDDNLGKVADTKAITLVCVGGSRDGRRINYKWYKNGQLMKADSSPIIATISGELKINPSEYTRDDGKYQCLVSDNTWSLISNMAELRLAYINGIQKADVRRTAVQYEGWQYMFSGYSHSKYPKPKFTWKLNGRTLKETDRISISEDGNLYIAQVSLNDAGKYSFEMQLGSLRQRRESINLAVARSSKTSDIFGTAMLGPKSRRVSLKQEQEVTFECFVTGKPMPSITWKKGDRILSHGTKYVMTSYSGLKKRLTIKNLNRADSGKYQCAFTRTALAAKFPEATLTVIDPPKVESLEPVNQIRHIGNYTTLKCKVKGTFSNFDVSWYRNGIKLSQSSKIFMNYKTYRDYRVYTLNVTKLNKDQDGGMYQCFATNEGGQDMAYTAINVLTMPPYIYYGPGIVYVVLNRPAKIVCKSRGSPPITYTWEKNGRPIKGDNGKNGTYIIKNVGQYDIAQYTCIASNGLTLGDTAKSTGFLQLVAPTVVVNKSSTVYASKGSYPYLYCGVKYDEKVNVTYRWYFEGDLIETGGRLEVTKNGRLIINGVSEINDGIYRCDSTSGVGDFSTTVELIVQAPPYVPYVPRVENVQPASVTLTWRAGYNGNSPIQYYKIGLRYENGTEAVVVQKAFPSGVVNRYDVPRLAPNTLYEFRVQAHNYVGSSPWSEYSAKTRTAEAAPSYKLKHVQGNTVNDNTIEVTWEEPPKVTWNGVLRGYYVAYRYSGASSFAFRNVKVTPATKRKLMITNLILNSPYDVKVQMFNDVGRGPYSDPIVVRTQEGLPSSAPRNLAVRNVSSRSVVLEWEPPPQQDWNGEITRYVIRVTEFNKKDIYEDRVAQHDKSAFTQVFNVTKLKTYTSYTFEVSAYNNKGGSPPSKAVQVRTTEDIPTAPQRLQIVDQFSDTISVKWVRPREVNGVLTGYVVKYWRTSSRPPKIMTDKIGGNALQAGITNLQANTKYTIEVAAETSAGVSKFARIDGQTQDVADYPKPPKALRVLEINSSALELTWQEGDKGNSPIIKYIIEGNNETGFANDRTSKWFNSLTVDDPFKIYNLPPVIIKYLRPSTTYRFRVRAYNKVGASAYSDVSVDVETAEDRPLSPPINIKVEPSDFAGELLLKWTPPPRETWNSPFITYTIELQEEGEIGNFTKITTTGIRGSAKSFRLPSLKKFTLYEIQMKTVNRIGDSPYSPVIIGQTQEYVPEHPPNMIRAIGVSGSSIKITWDEVSKDGRNGVVLGYKIYYRLVLYAAQDFTEIKLGNVKEYLLENLLGYTQYDIRILAYTKIGDGKRSDKLRPYPRTLETEPGPPSKLRFPTITTTVVVMTWAPPEMTGGNITQYRVSYRLRDDGRTDQWIKRPSLPSTKLSESIARLSPNKYYIFKVQAYTIDWGEDASAEIYTSLTRPSEKPKAPIILPISDSDITWRSIKVRWAVNKLRDQPIRYFTLNLRKGQGAWETHPKPLSGDSEMLTVWGLESNHMYSFQITATNDAGTSPPSEPSTPVRTLRQSTPGSPREVRITSPRPTTFRVQWQPPSLHDIDTEIKSYRLGYRLHETNPQSNPNYLDTIVSGSTREYLLNGLDEYTLYDIRLTAVDGNNMDLTHYLETRRTSAELPRRPSLSDKTSIGPTSVTIRWNSPGETKTPILGYKAVYEIPSRRRRAVVREMCAAPEPGAAYFSKDATQGTITGLQMYTRYVIVLSSYNTAGDSPPSNPISVRTAEGVPGPPARFDFDCVYDIEVDLWWEAPCEPNGVITYYILTVTSGSKQVQRKELSRDARQYRVVRLARRTDYKFELVAKTSRGNGIPKVLFARTEESANRPSAQWKPLAMSESNNNEVTLTWKNRCSGKTPITKYFIQYRTSSEKNPWVEGWRLNPSEIQKNRTDNTRWIKLSDLDPNTIYWFRIILQNKMGSSDPSYSSDSVSTGPPKPVASSQPIYEEIWFIAVMAVIAFLILLLLCICVCLCCRRRRRRGGKDLQYPVMELQPSTGLRPYSSIDETLSNGGSKTNRDEKPLVDDVDSEGGGSDEEASSMETKSDLSESDDEDDIPTKKNKMEAALREQDKHFQARSYSTDQLHNSPPPAYATFASSRGKGRSEPFLDPYADLDDDVTGGQPYRPPTRRSAFEPYDGESSESSDIANRKRGDPRSSSFRRALFTAGGPSQPEPERPYDTQPDHRPQPRKYRSLEKAVNENTKPPSYHDDDDDDDEDRSRQPSLPPEYRSDRSSDHSDERIPLTQGSSRYDSQDRAESPAPAYHSDDSGSSGKRQLTEQSAPQPQISSYSSFV